MDAGSGRDSRIGLYAISGVLTAIFLFAGGFALSNAPQAVAGVARYGYPHWFLFVVGAVEVLSAIALWVPRIRVLGALGICAIMVGAVITHLTHGEARVIPIPIALLILSATVAYARRDEIPALLGRAARTAPRSVHP